MRAFVVSLTVLLLTGCAGLRSSTKDGPLPVQFYAHDQGLEDRLKKAQQQFSDVSTGQASVWAAMRSNLGAAARREADALKRDAANERAATIAALDSLIWDEVKQDASADAKDATLKLTELRSAIPSTINEIETLRMNLKGSSKLAPEADAAKTAVLRTRDPADMKKYLDAVQNFLVFVRDDVAQALGGGGQASIRKLLAVARKAGDQTLVGTISELTDPLTKAGKDPKTVALPPDLQAATKLYLKRDFTTFGELLDFFTAKDARDASVVLALAADFDRTLLEIRRARLSVLEERLRLLNTRMIVEEQRRMVGEQIAAAAGTHDPEESVRAALDARLDAWLKNAADDDFHTGVVDLVQYIQLRGSLMSWSRVTTNELAVLAHRERVGLDEIATAAHARLTTLGLQGVTSFAEGGITEEQVANWLRALQTVGVAVIGGRI